jgi:murein DD-endopeptidase MepM/ murein hydrolase activator NlpD
MDDPNSAVSQTEVKVKAISLLRIMVLLLYAAPVIAASCWIMYHNASQSAAPKQIRSLKELQITAYDIPCDAVCIMLDSYKAICLNDKKKALYYLEKNSRIKGVKFKQYKMKTRDNFWTVAKKNNVDVDSIVGCNPDLGDLVARDGQVIIIPDEVGVLYQVKADEKPKNIADTFGINEKKIEAVNRTGFFLSRGDILFIPNATPLELNESLASIYEKRKLFRAPLWGRYSSLMGIRHDPIIQGVTKFHNGVDIQTPVGTNVEAAAAGRVTDAGWSNGYGNYIMIQHKNGYMTLYGHLSRLLVHEGQKVKAGTIIAKSGNTGRTTGPHLHFSIFKDNKVMNPLDYLW